MVSRAEEPLFVGSLLRKYNAVNQWCRPKLGFQSEAQDQDLGYT